MRGRVCTGIRTGVATGATTSLVMAVTSRTVKSARAAPGEHSAASPSAISEGTAIAVPTGPDEPPAEPAGEIESFLSAVQGMVHGGGEDAPLPLQSGAVAESDSDATDAASPDDWVADDGRSDWLPGTWVVDAPASPRRRASRAPPTSARPRARSS